MSIEIIAEQSKKINDIAENTPSTFSKIFDAIVSSISVGIFKSPPFSLENIFPSIDLFKNKYFKLISIFAIYLGLIIYVLSSVKLSSTRDMFLIYSVCFWIAVMAFSIVIVNPYDENSVEYTLRNKAIEKAKEVLEETKKESKPKNNDVVSSFQNNPLKLAPDGTTKMLIDSSGNPKTDSDGYVLIVSDDGKSIVNDIGDTFSIGTDGKVTKTSPPKEETLSSGISSVTNSIATSVSEQQNSLISSIKSFF